MALARSHLHARDRPREGDRVSGRVAQAPGWRTPKLHFLSCTRRRSRGLATPLAYDGICTRTACASHSARRGPEPHQKALPVARPLYIPLQYTAPPCPDGITVPCVLSGRLPRRRRSIAARTSCRSPTRPVPAGRLCEEGHCGHPPRCWQCAVPVASGTLYSC